MKKLMFAVAAAAMIGGVEAAGPVDGWEAYNFTTTLKTTKGVKANLKAKSNDCLTSDVTGYVRKQANVKIDGLIWGCWCDAIRNVQQFNGFKDYAVDGSLFWNSTDKQGFDDFANTTFEWDFINRIDTTAKKTEGFWKANFYFFDSEGNSTLSFEDLQGAGFGTAAGSIADNTVYIPSISGYAVGKRWYTCGEAGSTKACGIDIDPVDAYVWELCDCADSTDATVAFGSWSIKWNQTIANKLAKNDGMDVTIFATVCKLTAFQAAADAYGYVEPTPERTAAEKTYDTAVANLAAAKEYNEKLDAAEAVAFSNYTNTLFTTRAAAKKSVEDANDAMQEAKADVVNPKAVQVQTLAWAVSDKTETYWAAAEKYLYYWQVNNGSNTTYVTELKYAADLAKEDLDDAIDANSKVATTVKTTYKSAISTLYTKAAAFAKATIGVADLESEELTVAAYTYRDYQAKEEYEAYAKARDAARYTSDELKALQDKVDTAKLVCDATGGDCN